MSERETTDTVILRLSRLATSLALGVLVVLSLASAGYWAMASGYWSTTPAVSATTAEQPLDLDAVENGVDVMSGLIAEGDYKIVRAACTACHSGKLVTQNRATAEGWTQMIRWMQETQNLQDLGDKEPIIVNYLATYYAPESQGRRAPLAIKEWYLLEE